MLRSGIRLIIGGVFAVSAVVVGIATIEPANAADQNNQSHERAESGFDQKAVQRAAYRSGNNQKSFTKPYDPYAAARVYRERRADEMR